MNPILEQLARYAAQELERGVPEVTLSASLKESGWTSEWINAALSTAKQRAVPALSKSLNIPEVHAAQTPFEPSGRVHTPRQPLVRPVKTDLQKPTRRQPRSLRGVRNALIIIIALLTLGIIGLGIQRTIAYVQETTQQKVVHDTERREDLSVLLSDVSDYFVSHKSYPTRTQMNTSSFLESNGFSGQATTDPKWSSDNEACTGEDGKPVLAGNLMPGCYAYEVSTSKSNGVCNNASVACTKVKVSIWLEADNKPYAVTFDKNSQVD